MQPHRLPRLLSLSWILGALGAGLACRAAPQAPAAPAAAASEPAPLGLARGDMDRSADPAHDFYRFANGGWLDAHPIPDERSSWDAFSELDERVQLELRGILDEAASSDAAAGTVLGKLGAYHCACMDEARADAAGLAPVAPLLRAIDESQRVEELGRVFARLARHGLYAPFAVFGEQDAKDATRYVTWIYQSGLGLPDRDYYLREDDASRALLAKYEAHVGAMLGLAGAADALAAEQAQAIVALETRLARGSASAVERRDPEANYHLMSLVEAAELCPRMAWPGFLEELGYPRIAELDICQPGFVRAVEAELASTPLAVWKAYLRWQVLDGMAPFLTRALEQEDFAFKGQELRGQRAQRPRWKRCVEAADNDLGDLLGREYVARHFSERAKQLALAMVRDLTDAFRERLATRDWMSPTTRERARAKLDAIAVKIGYPDGWKEHGALALRPDALAANHLAAAQWSFAQRMDRVGRPIDRSEWLMSPQTVNAYYNPSMNEIVFPAAILQPPFFDERADQALNYGAIGAVIGHELTHGFDDEGSRFDDKGNLRQWWLEADRAEFERRAQKIAEHYARYTAVDELKIDGQLTLGENIADIGGVQIAYHALQRALERDGRPGPIDGFSPEQRLFLAWARAWRSNARPEFLRIQVQTNPHAPARFRVQGVIENVPEFRAAFPSTGEDDPRPVPTVIW